MGGRAVAVDEATLAMGGMPKGVAATDLLETPLLLRGILVAVVVVVAATAPLVKRILLGGGDAALVPFFCLTKDGWDLPLEAAAAGGVMPKL